ncbi:hypothetical protein [Lacrimispora sp.]|uniref:hypothetical protein n=1 Tax=Lacrimispora sp. TaxID=2719234 RepID=UPI0028B170D2|nr:hypothetical protein [Lacrimispora sp.]
MKKFLIGLMTATIALSSTIVSFAGEWKQTGYGWWYDNGNGSYTANNWQNINNTWYYFNQDGYMRTGWIPVNGKWYYCNANGEMAHDTWIDGKYYVGTDGVMYVNTTTPDGYKVDGNGIKNASISIKEIINHKFVSKNDLETYKWWEKNGDIVRADSRIKGSADEQSELVDELYPEILGRGAWDEYEFSSNEWYTESSFGVGGHGFGGTIRWESKTSALLKADFVTTDVQKVNIIDKNTIEINGESYVLVD